MFTFDVRATGIKETVAKLNAMQRDLGDKVLANALNETARQTKTQISRRIRDEYNIDAATVRERIEIRFATRKGQQFTATVIGNPAGRARRSLNVIRFLRAGATRQATRRGKNGLRAELRFRIRKTGGDVAIPGSFILNVSGHPVFERKDGQLVPVRTLGVPSMFQAKKVQIPVHHWIGENFPRIFATRLRFYMERMK